MIRLTFCLTVFYIALSMPLNAQIGVGEWRDHLPYTELIDISIGDNHVFGATESAITVYSKTDKSVRRISKVNELTESGISTIKYNRIHNTLVVGYQNGNVDLLINGQGINMADIKNSSILGSKSINNIHFIDNLAYLATGFGIVVIDIVAIEVADTYIIGPNSEQVAINSVITDENYIYAATDSDILKAELDDPFLANFQNWTSLDNVPPAGSDAFFEELELLNGFFYLKVEDGNDDVVYTSSSSEPLNWSVLEGLQDTNINDISAGEDNHFYVLNEYDLLKFDEQNTLVSHLESPTNTIPNKIVVDDESVFWFADRDLGIVTTSQETSSIESIAPDGPDATNVRRMDAFNNNIWVASGGVDQSWVPQYHKFGAYGFVDEDWQHFDAYSINTNELVAVNDIMDVAINPANNDEVYISSYEEGLLRLVNAEAQDVFRTENSTLLSNSNDDDTERVMVTGLDFDSNNNLWIANNFSSIPLHVRTADGDFIGYEFGTALSVDIEKDRVKASSANNLVWVTLPRGDGLLVFDSNGTLSNKSDDNFKILTNEEGNGGLPSNDVYCVEEDLDGEIWVGTLQGLGIFYSPQSIFSEEGADAQQILIEQDGNIQILLETEAITAITIDGANRKWIGTESSGVFLLSPDGTEQIYHFTEENSPLLSNNIFDIVINYEKGEVFFATEDGIISFLSTSSNFDPEMSEVKIYPNPVRETFSGSIRIDGLDFQSDVKITDVSGNVVYQTTSNGGRAIWDGKDFNGNRVATGVYLVFATNDDGSATNVGKIAFIH